MKSLVRPFTYLLPLGYLLIAADTTPPATDAGWPRQFTDGTAKLVLHQPQIESWPEYKKLKAQLVAELTPSKSAQPVWGVVQIDTDTSVDLDNRVVTLANFNVSSVSYPSAKDAAEGKTWQDLTTKLLPPVPTSIALDRVLAYVDSDPATIRTTEVKLDPPPILVSMQAAVLVIIDGKPILLDIEKTSLQKVLNTNWDLFFDKKEERYYIRDDKSWLSAKSLNDAWSAVTKLPKDFSKLPETDEYKEVLQAIKPVKPAINKLVLVVDKPSELIVVNGQPALAPVAGTKLEWVTNTECDLFFDTTDRQYYYLTSGRWFRSAELKSNTWTSATTTLPEDFKKIPNDHPRAHVLASVPGTRQAEEAVLNASIPEVATIDRKSVKAEAKYVGDPKFEPIGNTGVSYATNSPNDIFQAEGQYYMCLDGVWLVSQSATGPWAAADKVPDVIYKIPPDSPKYNVTYVTVENSTPDTVTYSYTSGYTGVYIGFGVAMWGTGYYYPPYYAYGYYPYPVYWPCPYYTYGASVWYNPATGAYGRGSAVYGPYGGAARGAAYNPVSGRYSWGRAAWGPYGAAATGGFYNPSTGRWGGGYRASNGYQSWGQGVVGRGGNYARGGYYSDARGTIAGAKTSNGGKVIAGRGAGGQQGFVGRTGGGDVYAGRDGNVYKRDQSGQWYKNNGGSWDSIDRGNAGQGNRPSLQGGNQTMSRESVQNNLNRDAQARNWGNYNTQRSTEAKKGGSGWSSGGFTSPRSSGFGVRSPGFGRRR